MTELAPSPAPDPPDDDIQFARLLDELAVELVARRGRQVPIDRFGAIVQRHADRIADEYLNELCRRIRALHGDELDEHDAVHAARLRRDVRFALWHAVRELPSLDAAGHPETDESGHLIAPEPLLRLHFSDAQRSRRHERRTTLPPYSLDGETLDAALGVLDVRKALRVGRLRSRYARPAARADEIALALAQDGWRDGSRIAAMAPALLADALDCGELTAQGVVLRVVRAKLADSRRAGAAGGAGAGGCLLTLETLAICRAPSGRPFLARVLDTDVPHQPDALDDQPTATVAGLERVAEVAWRSLLLIAETVPGMPRVAVLDETLPLGPSCLRTRRSEIVRPGADATRATTPVAPAELLVTADGAVRGQDGAGGGALAEWTVLARADDDLPVTFGRTLGEAPDPLATRRRLALLPTAEDVAKLDDAALMTLVQWVASTPHTAAPDHAGAIELALALRDDSYQPPRSAGHRVMFAGTNDAGKVDAMVQVTLTYTLAEELHRLARE